MEKRELPNTRTLQDGDGAPGLSKLCWELEKCSFDMARAVTHLLSQKLVWEMRGSGLVPSARALPGKGAVTGV